MTGMRPDEFTVLRRQMVRAQLRGRGLTDERVLAALERLPRHRFVPEELVDQAYDDHPLPIGTGQTISQPFIVGYMAEAAEIGGTDRVLEVGTGSGYGAAVLAQLAAEVYTIERHANLAATAAGLLHELGFDNIMVVEGDGALGLAEHGPYDAIVVAAAAETLPPALPQQLADGGRLVIPVGPQQGEQRLLRLRRDGERFAHEDLGGVRFVPLVTGTGTPPSAAES